jgi:hypothetical protein
METQLTFQKLIEILSTYRGPDREFDTVGAVSLFQAVLSNMMSHKESINSDLITEKMSPEQKQYLIALMKIIES